MKLHLHSERPDKPFRPLLADLVKDAVRVDLAVAFVTASGAEAVHAIIDQLDGNANIRLLVSVLFPTDLDAIAALAERIDVHIHLAYALNAGNEVEKCHGQFHSKIIYIEHEQQGRTIVIGSHNWTTNGLDGGNLEASLIVDCVESDTIVPETRAHIDECRRVSERFDPARMDLYETIQRKFQTKLAMPQKRLRGFEKCSGLVILAEDWTDGRNPSGELYVHVPIDWRREIDTDDRIFVYVFAKGALFKNTYPLPTPTLYTADVLTKDLAADHSISPDQSSYGIRDIANPTLELVTSNPRRSDGTLLLSASFARHGRSEYVPLFQAGPSPQVEPGLETAPEDAIYADDVNGAPAESLQRQSDSMRMVPTHLREETVLRVPFQFALPNTTQSKVEQFVRSSNRSKSTHPFRVLFESAKEMSKYACLVKFKSNSEMTDFIYSSPHI